MKIETRHINIPEGSFETEFIVYDEQDKSEIKKVFDLWVTLSKNLIKLGSTRIGNFPEGISEAIFAIEMNAPRCIGSISGAASSFDNYDFSNNKRIQLKARASTGPTSFGPRSVFDECYLFNMTEIANSSKNQKKFNGNYQIFKIGSPEVFHNIILNKKSGETFLKQQQQGRRPRLDIFKSIIVPRDIKPIKSGNIDDW